MLLTVPTRSLWALFTIYFTYVQGSNPDSEECSNFTIPGCSCAFLGQIFGITCDTDADLSTLANSLESQLGVNHTYEITLEHFETIPARVVQDLILFRLVVDDPETAFVSENAFDGVFSLKNFHVYRSSLSSVPNFKGILQELERVNIDSSLLTEVQGEFQNLPVLTRLSLRNNTIESVREDAFKGSTAIQFLDLSHNRIVSLPEIIFLELKDMIKIDLSFNRLHTVHGLFKDFGSQMKFLNLEINNLTDADDIIVSEMPMLDSLTLSNNPLRKLTVNTFNNKLPKLHFLYVDNCNLTEFSAGYFSELSELYYLDLSFNQIKHLGNDNMNFGSDLDLVMNGNQIESFAGGITLRIKRLFLADNNLKVLSNLLQYTHLSEVELSRNRLTALEKGEFYGAVGSEVVVFRGNEIERIDFQCFISLRRDLYDLDLSGNKLTSLNGSVQYLSVLNYLNVSHNLLEALDYTEFKGVNELSELYIQNNRIVVMGGDFQNVPKLQYLYLKDNPLKCDCQLYLLFLKKLKNGFPKMDITPCSQTRNASEVLPYQPCPSPCSCHCERGAETSFVTADCSSQQMTSVPSALSEWSKLPTPVDGMYQINDPNFAVYDQMVSLDLSNNSIESLGEVHFPSNLEKLHLAKNHLTTFPYSIMNLEKLKEVTLSGNQWTCGCDDGKAVEFRNWLLPENRHIPDMNKTVCAKFGENKTIVSVSEAELCPSNVGIYIICAVSIVGFLALIVVIKVLYTRYQLSVNVWVWPFSQRATRIKRTDIEKDKIFDVFVAFCPVDYKFVDEKIIKKIKTLVPSICLYIPCEQYYSEHRTREDVMEPALISKKTVLVLTRNFLESERCVSNFLMAHDGFQQVVVIKLEDLTTNVDPRIQVLLDTATCLTWEERKFWQKLINLLPRTFGSAREHFTPTTPLIA